MEAHHQLADPFSWLSLLHPEVQVAQIAGHNTSTVGQLLTACHEVCACIPLHGSMLHAMHLGKHIPSMFVVLHLTKSGDACVLV